MGNDLAQQPLFEEVPIPDIDQEESSRQMLDELFALTERYRNSAEYLDLLRFIGRFRMYSPFNAMLVHLQMPGAMYVAPASRWKKDYGRRLMRGARPLVILKPRGPVMFVYDISQTEPIPGARPLPVDVLDPFQITTGFVAWELPFAMENARRDGVWVKQEDLGLSQAGSIERVPPGQTMKVQVRSRHEIRFEEVPYRYKVRLNATHSDEVKYATLAHELGHLYCGHLGSPNSQWWPDRRACSLDVREFEAESVAYLVCSRTGMKPESHRYLVDYLGPDRRIPDISMDTILKAAGLVEQMGKGRMRLRSTEPAPVLE